MDREKLLAAETFSYSYANYANHLGIGHVRFEELMPTEKQLDQLIQAGYDRLRATPRQQGQTTAACDQWLAAWELVKQMATPAMRTDEAFDAAHPNLSQPIGHWVGELEMELHNAGLDAPRYFEHRLRFVHEYLAQFPDVDEDYYVNLRRAEGEALWLLDRQAQAEAVYQALVEQLPDKAWGYIGWADQYHWGVGRPSDYPRAEAILLPALDRPNLDDRRSVLERLIDLYQAWDKPEKLPALVAKLEAERARLEAEHNRLEQELRILQKVRQSQAPPKLGRNDPCWCGRGKKYKKCHWKSDRKASSAER